MGPLAVPKKNPRYFTDGDARPVCLAGARRAFTTPFKNDPPLYLYRTAKKGK